MAKHNNFLSFLQNKKTCKYFMYISPLPGYVPMFKIEHERKGQTRDCFVKFGFVGAELKDYFQFTSNMRINCIHFCRISMDS